MKKTEILLLGRFAILVDGEDIVPILGKSRKKISLLQYLLINKNSQFTNFNLFEALWSSDELSNPESALKTLISRLRQDLNAIGLGNLIVTKQGVYQWNDKVYNDIDIFKFEELANKCLTCCELTEPFEKNFEDMLSLYRGDLLPDYDNEIWIIPKSIHYHSIYLNAVYKYISLLSAQKRYHDILRVTRRALEIDTFDSKLNLELMTAMLALGLKSEAMSHYNYTVKLYYTQLGTKPSENILEFYKELIRVEHDSNASLNAISEDLENDKESDSAFVCDYSIFKDIYRINMRNLQRLNICMFLGVVTLSSSCTKPSYDPDLLLLNKTMGMLQDVLKDNLRKGDTISRYGPSQFAILLPTTNHKTGSLALERVKNEFYHNCQISGFILTYKLKPIIYGASNNNTSLKK